MSHEQEEKLVKGIGTALGWGLHLGEFAISYKLYSILSNYNIVLGLAGVCLSHRVIQTIERKLLLKIVDKKYYTLKLV